jgi:hypothetical protein
VKEAEESYWNALKWRGKSRNVWIKPNRYPDDAPARPRKAKCLERKSTTMFNRTKKLKSIEILKVCNFLK